MTKKDIGKKKTVAEKTFQHSDYFEEEQLSSGMAITHEQVSDTYMEGTIDRRVSKQNARDDYHEEEEIPRRK